MSNRPLPQLMDARMIAAETGLTVSAAESVMRKCTVVKIEGLRRSFVRRSELLERMYDVPRPAQRQAS